MSDMFEQKAQEWDKNDMVTQLSSAISASILANVELEDHMQVLDFGAGTGLISSRIAPHVNRITAVDISQSMLEQLAQKKELADKVEIRCQDIITEPLQERFDLIMSAMAMHHVQDTDSMISRFAALLKPGGKIALADLDKEDGSFHPPETQGVFHSGFDRAEFRSLLQKHGFRDIRLTTAHTVIKEGKTYPVFLAVATRA